MKINSMTKVFVLIALLSEVKSSFRDEMLFNLEDRYECKDLDKTNMTLNSLWICLSDKWDHQNINSNPEAMCCFASEIACTFARLVQNDCKPMQMVIDRINDQKEAAIDVCSMQTIESIDTYYSKVCPKLVNIAETNDTCKEYMPCDQSPDQIEVQTEIGSDFSQSFRNSAQILLIISIFTLLYITIH